MGLLLAGADMTAVDNVCVDIMGFAIDDIRHLTPVNDIEVVGEKVEDVRSDFKKPLKAIMRVNPFVIYLDDSACTMCTVSLYKALSKLLGASELKHELIGKTCVRSTLLLGRRNMKVTLSASGTAPQKRQAG